MDVMETVQTPSIDFHMTTLCPTMEPYDIPLTYPKTRKGCIPAPLVSMSFSLGSRITGYSVTDPPCATTVGSAPWVITTVRARVPLALGRAAIFRAISFVSSVCKQNANHQLP